MQMGKMHFRESIRVTGTFLLVAFCMRAGAQPRYIAGNMPPGAPAPAQHDLAYYLDAAKRNSPLLKDLQNQARSNLLDSARIRAGYLPQLNGVSTNNYAPTYKGWGYDEAITNGANFAELVTFTQRLVGKQNLQTQYNAITLGNQALAISGKISEQDLKKTVTAQYITAYGDWQQYLQNAEVQQLLSDEEVVLRAMTEKGVYRQTDYLTFKVTLQQQALLVSQTRLQFQSDFAALNYSCGLVDTSLVALGVPALDPIEWLDPSGTVFYRQFVVDSLVIRNQDALIDFDYKAKVNLYADAGYQSSFSVTPYKNFGASVGVNVTVPIYDGHQRKMRHDKQALSEFTRQGYRDFFTSQYAQQIAQLLQQLHSTQDLIDDAKEQSRYTKGLIDANRRLLATGDAKIADCIIAISNYLNVQNLITLNTINKLQIINQINYWNRK